MLLKDCLTLTGSIAGSINNQRNHVQGANPKGRDIRFRTPMRVHFALTFKHAVEFSSFGCAPRFGLPTAAWGNSTYFTRSCSRCQTGLSDPPSPRLVAGLGGSLLGGTPYPYCFGLGSFRSVRSGSLRAVRLTEKACPTLLGPLLGVKPSFPALPARVRHRA